ncbi:solute carrier organic anion transporter family member 74D-like, partial [Oppia nitens]|uniref:solute carrier organic anion transporter family member 74D-like n=1 Tax=Oppia nitens TaxID=1686743 RepID=UPI0023DA2F35
MAIYSSVESLHPRKCGLGSCSPKSNQPLANVTSFVASITLMGIIQGAPYMYMSASLTTLERRYSFGSLLMGFILIGDDISAMIFEPIIGYLANRMHRPRMLALAQILSGTGCFLASSLYFIYGPPEHLSTANTRQANSVNHSMVTEFCNIDDNKNNNISENECQTTNANRINVIIPVLFLFVSTFLSGLGSSAYYVVGMPFIDDSVKKKRSPFIMSIMVCSRIVGPAFAAFVSSIVLRYYENPFVDPGITDLRDPRWVGAWWLGFAIIGVCLYLSCLPMLFFPSDLKISKNKATNGNKLTTKPQANQSLKQRLKKLFTNPIFMCYTFGSIFQMFGWAGYWNFKGKYIESQYRKSASTANLFTGMIGLVPSAIGMLMGGAFISFLKPGPRLLTSFITIVELLSTMGLFSALALGCPPLNFANLPDQTNNFNLACNANCTCSMDKFQPICDPNSLTNYMTPCLAGCPMQTSIMINGSKNQYMDCNCVSGLANEGYCDIDCGNNFRTFVIIIGICSLIGQLSRVGNLFIAFRVVDDSEKHFAFGVLGALYAIFAWIPGPLVYGAITNSACKVWEKKCGQTGNCLVYDTDKFKNRLFGVSLVFVMIGSMFDVLVIFMSSRIKNIYEDNDNDDETDNNENNSHNHNND